jgi:hypothetical protein
MHFTETSIRFTPIAPSAEQLYIRGISPATTGKRDDMIIFQQLGTAAAFAHAAIPGENNSLCRGRNMPALGKRGNSQQQDGNE